MKQSIAVLALLGLISKTEAVQVGSLAEIDNAFTDIFGAPEDSKLIMVDQYIAKDQSDSSSDSSSSDSDDDLVQMRDEDGDKDADALLDGLTDVQNVKTARRATGKDMNFEGCKTCGKNNGENPNDETLKYTSNRNDSGKLSGYSTEDPKIATMMDDYTGADNDTFMTEMIEDYGTKGLKTPANPDGVQLTKWNGERATRKFVETALKIDGAVLDGWMAKYFEKAWDRYDVNKAGYLDGSMVATYLRSTLGDFKAQFNLKSEDHLDRVLRETA